MVFGMRCRPETSKARQTKVTKRIALWEWKEGWEERELEPSYQVSRKADPGEGSFAASNSVLQLAQTPQIDLTWKYAFRFASGTAKHSYVSIARYENTQTCEPCRAETLQVETPMAQNNESSGIFSLNFRSDFVGVVVGGDLKKPDGTIQTAAYSKDGGQSWTASTTPPHGYRSAVQWSESLKLWITVGTNGSDVSRNDGKTWQPLDNGNWNALSLPFVVGPNGRIARLNPAALPGRP